MLLFLSLFACGDASKDKVEAKVEEAKKVEVVKPVAGKKELVVQPGATLRATASKVIGSHPIDFKDFRGRVVVDGEKLENIDFKVQMKTLKSDNDNLTKHLLDPDFFDVEKHPTSAFQSTSITEKASDGATHEITGNLSLHGQSKSITFPATVKWADGGIEATTEFTLDRQDFGMTYKGKADNLIQDKVVMEIRFSAK